MGALVSTALRPLKSFNIENRAHRVISKEKPTPAPQYAASLEDLKRTLQSDPDLDKKLDQKDPGLDERLKDVYVTSFGRPEDDLTRERKQSADRPLPQDKKQVEDFDYGFKEPDRIPYGRTTLRQAVEFMTLHQSNPDEVTPAKIALEYKLKEEDVVNILKYFKTYEVYVPGTQKSAAVFAGPAMLRKQLEDAKHKAIEDKKNSVDSSLDSNEVSSPRDGSIGAASLGARREAPAPRRAPSIRSDERPLATQGDMLNSIKFQRRLRDTLQGEKFNTLFHDKNSVLSSTTREKSSLRTVNSKTSSAVKQRVPSDFGTSRERPSNMTQPRSFLHITRPSSPKGRRNMQPSFY